MKWNDLTMKERSDLMSLFLKSGVGSLSDMKKIYEEALLKDNAAYKYSGEEDTAPIQNSQNNWNAGYLYFNESSGREEIPIPLNQQDDSYTG